MKPPKNFYSNLDRRKQGLPELPEASAADVGKVVKVGESGAYELGEDENTVIVANPDTESTERLDKLTVGDTTYLVNDDVLPTVLKAVRLKINTIHGSDANVVMNGLAFKNSINGDMYDYGGSDTITSDIAGTPDLSGLLEQYETYFASSNLPCNIDITFADGLDTTQFNDFDIKCGYYENASPLSVEVFVSADGENFVSVAAISNLTYTRDSYVVIYEFGAVELKIPAYTSADRGKFLGIDNTDHIIWDNVPSELPTVTSADAGKVLAVNNQGAWGAELKGNTNSYLFEGTVEFDTQSNTYNGTFNLFVNGIDNNYVGSAVTSTKGEIIPVTISDTTTIELYGMSFNNATQSLTKGRLADVLKRCMFLNNIDNKIYKITNLVSSGANKRYTFELTEVSA